MNLVKLVKKYTKYRKTFLWNVDHTILEKFEEAFPGMILPRLRGNIQKLMDHC